MLAQGHSASDLNYQSRQPQSPHGEAGEPDTVHGRMRVTTCYNDLFEYFLNNLEDFSSCEDSARSALCSQTRVTRSEKIRSPVNVRRKP